MTTITLRNADKAKQEALAGLQQLIKTNQGDALGADNQGGSGFSGDGTDEHANGNQDEPGTGDDPAGLVQGDEGQGAEDGHQSADTEKKTGDDPGKTNDAEGGRVAELESQLAAMTKSFKAIQSAITPTQQQNAALRRENEALKAKLGLVDAEGKPVNRLSKAREAAQKASEVVPEAGEALLALLDSIEHQGVEAEEARSAQSATVTDAAMSAIYSAHRDADTVAASDSPFWKFVDSLPGSGAYRAILASPWQYEGGAQTVIDLMADYKTLAAQAQAQPPAPAKRPTNVAAPVKAAPSAPSRSSAERPWTPQELDARTRGLNRMDPKKLDETRNALRQQLYRVGQRRG